MVLTPEYGHSDQQTRREKAEIFHTENFALEIKALQQIRGGKKELLITVQRMLVTIWGKKCMTEGVDGSG